MEDPVRHEIVGQDTMLYTDTSFVAQVSRIKLLATQPDFIYIATCGSFDKIDGTLAVQIDIW